MAKNSHCKCNEPKQCRPKINCPPQPCPCPCPLPFPFPFPFPPIPPIPPIPPVTNIAVTGTGPFGAAISFTVANTTVVTAENVNVFISVPFASGSILVPGGIVVTQGTYIINGNTIFWNVGTLLGGQSANIVINQVPGISIGQWTAVATTSTAETTLFDNVASVVVPIPL